MVTGDPVIVIAGPFIMIVAPLPLVIVTPTSFIKIIAPVVVFSMMPPVGPGTSLSNSVFCPVV